MTQETSIKNVGVLDKHKINIRLPPSSPHGIHGLTLNECMESVSIKREK